MPLYGQGQQDCCHGVTKALSEITGPKGTPSLGEGSHVPSQKVVTCQQPCKQNCGTTCQPAVELHECWVSLAGLERGSP